MVVSHELTVPRLRAVSAEMTSLLAIATGNVVHVLGLITVFRNVAFLTAVATSSAASVRAIFGKVTG